MKYLWIVFLSGLFFGFSGIANAASPTIADVYQMLLKQQEKIASLEANQRSLERDVTNSKLREARLRDDLHKAEIQLASVQKATSNDFGEPIYDAPQREEGFVASAGLLYVKPYATNKQLGNDNDHDLGFNMTAGYQAANNVDYAINYKHFGTDDASWRTSTVSDTFKVDYDVLDFVIGKRLQLAESVSMRFSGGLRYAAIDEESIQLNGTTTTGGKSDLWGVGLLAGIAPEWNPVNSNFQIFSSLSGSFLAGGFHSPRFGIPIRDKHILFSMVQASAGIGYLVPTDFGDIEIKASYQYELVDINSQLEGATASTTTLFDYKGYQGIYGSIGYAFGDMN